MAHPGVLVARLAWLLSLLSIATSVAHIAAVRHVRCPEHGELVELHGARAAPAAFDGLAIAELAFDDRHDEHCPLAHVPATHVRAAPPTLANERHSALEVVALLAPAPAHQTVDALGVAPKQGPPSDAA